MVCLAQVTHLLWTFATSCLICFQEWATLQVFFSFNNVGDLRMSNWHYPLPLWISVIPSPFCTNTGVLARGSSLQGPISVLRKVVTEWIGGTKIAEGGQQANLGNLKEEDSGTRLRANQRCFRAERNPASSPRRTTMVAQWWKKVSGSTIACLLWDSIASSASYLQ